MSTTHHDARLELNIETPQVTFVFSCICRRSEDPSNRSIEREFYEKKAEGVIPQGTHHEMELVEGPWDRQGLPKLHIHVHPVTGTKFVCWTGSLPTVELALSVFKYWGIGTAYTLLTGKDFIPLLMEHNSDWGALGATLEKDFGIRLIGTKTLQ